MIHINNEAQNHICKLIQREQQRYPNLVIAGLRIRVTGGGCGGMQYQMGFITSSDINDDDKIFLFNSSDIMFSVIIDQDSYQYIEDMTLEYTDSIQGAGFKFQNPNASNTCGCGKSFS